MSKNEIAVLEASERAMVERIAMIQRVERKRAERDSTLARKSDRRFKLAIQGR